MSALEKQRLVRGDSNCLRDPVLDRTQFKVQKPDWVVAYERGDDVEKPYDQKGDTTRVKGYSSQQEYENEAKRVSSGEQPYRVYSVFYGKKVDYRVPAPPYSQLYQGRNRNQEGFVDVTFPAATYLAGGGGGPPPYSNYPTVEEEQARRNAHKAACQKNLPPCKEMSFDQAMTKAFCGFQAKKNTDCSK